MASDVNGKEPYLHFEELQKCKWLLPELLGKRIRPNCCCQFQKRMLDKMRGVANPATEHRRSQRDPINILRGPTNVNSFLRPLEFITRTGAETLDQLEMTDLHFDELETCIWVLFCCVAGVSNMRVDFGFLTSRGEVSLPHHTEYNGQLGSETERKNVTQK